MPSGTPEEYEYLTCKYTLDPPVTVSTVSYYIDGIELNFVNHMASFHYHTVKDDATTHYDTYVIDDLADFDNFYCTYDSHASLYDALETGLGLTGEYTSD